ncbi:uncharacterized protein TNCV_3581591 [Trichonephila clavipes]|nr:uncharacterized protein TNCV_3581591 [Trichonephila clavipes]
MNETTQQEKTTQLSSRNEQLNLAAGTKQLNSSVGTKQLNSTGENNSTRHYTRAFGDGPRNFEPWSSDVLTLELAPPLLTTTPHQREDVSALDRFNVHRCPTRRVFSGTGLELVTRQATIRYLYHSATVATQQPLKVKAYCAHLRKLDLGP